MDSEDAGIRLGARPPSSNHLSTLFFTPSPAHFWTGNHWCVRNGNFVEMNGGWRRGWSEVVWRVSISLVSVKSMCTITVKPYMIYSKFYFGWCTRQRTHNSNMWTSGIFWVLWRKFRPFVLVLYLSEPRMDSKRRRLCLFSGGKGSQRTRIY
jgi:hypothetical protein